MKNRAVHWYICNLILCFTSAYNIRGIGKAQKKKKGGLAPILNIRIYFGGFRLNRS